MALRRLAGHGGLKPGLSRIHPGFEQPLEVLDLEQREVELVPEPPDLSVAQRVAAALVLGHRLPPRVVRALSPARGTPVGLAT